jgi:ABC-type polysaccharide/polyol phosphate transport system ATPase subunit
LTAVIRARNVGKRYLRVHEPPMLLRDMAAIVTGHRQRVDEFWALRDVSFEVERGEMLGIVGRNGSGKSTLMTLVAGTSFPDEGSVSTRGRLSVLLALGAGFNLDMTGEENIIVNAGLLGLSIPEARARMRQIIEFAELEHVIDTKIRFYSSGMMARLGFAIAINVSPDILLVDEVLSVGDAGFQEKCSQEIRRMQAEGATVLFVSHGMLAVQSLCKRALWLKDGKLEKFGPVDEVARAYESYALGEAAIERHQGLAGAFVPAAVSLAAPTAEPAGESTVRLVSRPRMDEPSHAHHFAEGFHVPESGWRWTAKRFAVDLATSDYGRTHGANLHLSFWIPPRALVTTRRCKLEASIGDFELGSQDFELPGHQRFSVRVPAEQLSGSVARFLFAVACASDVPDDPRELGVLVTEVALEEDSNDFEVRDPAFAHLLAEGFYDVEHDWRWTKRTFAVDLAAPEAARKNGGVLRLGFAIPPRVFEARGPCRLSVDVNGFRTTMSFERPGPHEFTARIPSSHLGHPCTRVRFSVDRTVDLPNEARELGVVVKSVALDSQEIAAL